MDHSPLGTLPAEMRNTIYELVLVQDIITIEHENQRRKVKLSIQNGRQNAVSLMQTCAFIRNEASQIFYASNTFKILLRPEGLGDLGTEKTAPATMKPLRTFIDLIGPINVAALRDVSVVMDPYAHCDEGRDTAFKLPMSRVIELVLLELRTITENSPKLHLNFSVHRPERPRWSWWNVDPVSITVEDGRAALDPMIVKVNERLQAIRSRLYESERRDLLRRKTIFLSWQEALASDDKED